MSAPRKRAAPQIKAAKVDDAEARRAAAAFDKQQRKRETDLRKEALARTKKRERKAAQVARAQQAFDAAEREHDARGAAIEGNETISTSARRRNDGAGSSNERSWVPRCVEPRRAATEAGIGTELRSLGFVTMQLRNIDKLCIAAAFPLALFLLAIAYAPFLLGWNEAFDSHPL
ncbi:hypothetical protein [Tardiphaga sp. 709]|uniref:hypothetical protein n=1 Tax=Tardiphaga sp. 709 TaxID=3076039 RepID=UPI0028E4183C|nr:hypothetical protein [Tardiphaga sp. 709]WNV11687.1 hypothetical protein RSO67_11185 [Tardiphaga sp. 709]